MRPERLQARTLPCSPNFILAKHKLIERRLFDYYHNLAMLLDQSGYYAP
jgi:hypothetical protein